MLRASWKGYLRLSQVSCAVALYPASTWSERIALRMRSERTGHRLPRGGIEGDGGTLAGVVRRIRGDDALRGRTIELSETKLDGDEVLVIESFVPRGEVDEAYLGGTYYAAPDGPAAAETFAILCEAMRRRNVAAVGRTMLHGRARVVLLEPQEQGLLATLLRYGCEVRGGETLFGEIEDIEPSRDPLDVVDVLRGADPTSPSGSVSRGRGKPH